MNHTYYSHQRGFTIGEVIAVMISLSVISLSASTLILLTKRFSAKQQNTVYSLEAKNRLINNFCSRFQNSSIIQIDRSKSFTYNPNGGTGNNGEYAKIKQDGEGETRPAVLSFPLGANSNTNFTSPSKPGGQTHSAVSGFLNGDFKQGSCVKTAGTGTCGGSPPSCTPSSSDTSCKHKTPTKAHVKDGCTSGCISGAQSYASKFYDVYADTHTIATYTVPVGNNPNVGQFGQIAENTGVILATRCVENKSDDSNSANRFLGSEEGSVIDATDLSVSDQGTHTHYNETALYILEGMKYRPFYFPDVTSPDGKIKCCDVTANNTIDNSACDTLDQWTPITYFLRFHHLAESEVVTDGKVKSWLTSSGQTTASDYNSLTDQNTYLENAKGLYKKELLKKFSIPITFTQVNELPLDQKAQQMYWASSFIAPSVEHQEDFIRFKWISVENGCYLSKLVANCPFNTRTTLAQTFIPGTKPPQSMKQFLRIQTRDCPFQVRGLANTGSAIPLGIQR